MESAATHLNNFSGSRGAKKSLWDDLGEKAETTIANLFDDTGICPHSETTFQATLGRMALSSLTLPTHWVCSCIGTTLIRKGGGWVELNWFEFYSWLSILRQLQK